MARSIVCPWWLAYTFDNPLRRLVQKPGRILGPYVLPGMTVLDVGCGLGYFSLGLAGLVGPEGRVVAVDLQPRMLEGLRHRAKRAGLDGRIERRLCESGRLGLEDLTGRIDFALAFYMVHELPDQAAFFREILSLLKPEARLLIAEPSGHVSRAEFEATLSLARSSGLEVSERPRVVWSRTALLRRHAAPERGTFGCEVDRGRVL